MGTGHEHSRGVEPCMQGVGTVWHAWDTKDFEAFVAGELW